MSHALTNNPLDYPYVFITDHNTQKIISATDALLDLLGYSIVEIVQEPITRYAKLNPRMTEIPECTIKQAKRGYPIRFQFSIHRHEEKDDSMLDYWLMFPIGEEQTILITPSMLCLNVYGTIEQVENLHFKQPVEQLGGHTIMTYVHNQDVLALCHHLACVTRNKIGSQQDSFVGPVLLRWSSKISHKMIMDSKDDYEWMSFIFVANQDRPLCIARSLQCRCKEVEEMRSTKLYYNVYLQVKRCAEKSKIYLKQCVDDSHTYIMQYVETSQGYVETSKVYLKEYAQYMLGYLLDKNNLIGHFIRSNQITKSVGLLELFSAILDQ